MENKQSIEQELILCNDICNRLINYIRNEEYEMVNIIFSFSIKKFDDLSLLLSKINQEHKNLSFVDIVSVLSKLVEASSFEELAFLLENELLYEFNKIKNYFELDFSLIDPFKTKSKYEIKTEILLCKSYINKIISDIDVERYDEINTLLEKYNYEFERIIFLLDMKNDEIITSNVLRKILKTNKKIDDFQLIKSSLQLNDLPEIERIEEILGLRFIPKDEDLLSDRYKQNCTGAVSLEKYQAEVKKILLDKLSNGEYKEEYIKCNCGADDYTVISKIDRHGVPVSQVICKECGLVYLNPRMNQEAYNDFYDKYYRDLYEGNYYQQVDDFNKAVKESYDYKLIYLSNLVGDMLKTEKLNILEIGCGRGEMLEKLEHYGHNVIGIDLDSNCINVSQNKGLNAKQAHTTDLIEEYSGKFDLIITMHVVEHFLDLDEELGNIKKLLKPNGQFYIEVPGIKNTAYGYDFLFMIHNVHTYYFNLCTLTNVLNRNGFELVKGTENVHAVYRINEDVKPQIDTYNYQYTLEYMKFCEDYIIIDK